MGVHPDTPTIAITRQVPAAKIDLCPRGIEPKPRPLTSSSSMGRWAARENIIFFHYSTDGESSRPYSHTALLCAALRRGLFIGNRYRRATRRPEPRETVMRLARYWHGSERLTSGTNSCRRFRSLRSGSRAGVESTGADQHSQQFESTTG